MSLFVVFLFVVGIPGKLPGIFICTINVPHVLAGGDNI